MHSDFEELLSSFTESTRRAINDERLESLDALNRVPYDDLVDTLGLRPHDLRNLEWYRNPLTRAWKSFVLSSLPSSVNHDALAVDTDLTTTFLTHALLPACQQKIYTVLGSMLLDTPQLPTSWPQLLLSIRESESISANSDSANTPSHSDVDTNNVLQLIPWGLAHTICLDSEPGRALPLTDILFPLMERSSASYTLLKSYTIGEWVSGEHDGDHYPDQLLDKAWVRQCLHDLGMRGADDSVSVFLHLAALTMSPYLQALLARSVLVEHLLSEVPFVFSRIPSQIAWPEGTSERRDAVWAWVAAVQQRAM